MADKPILPKDGPRPDRVRSASGAVVAGRRAALLGQANRDETSLRALFDDPAPEVREAAVLGLCRVGLLTLNDVNKAMSDEHPLVRRGICEIGALLPKGASAIGLLSDLDDRVVESAAYCSGELEDSGSVDELIRVAREHDDPLCREAAIAGLGAIGAEKSRTVLLASLGGPPAIRRRAVVALSNFDGEDVTAALRLRLADRDWQVREAAEIVLGEADSSSSG